MTTPDVHILKRIYRDARLNNNQLLFLMQHYTTKLTANLSSYFQEYKQYPVDYTYNIETALNLSCTF